MQNNNNNNNNNKANTKNETNKIMQICKNVTCYSYDRATDKDMAI